MSVKALSDYIVYSKYARYRADKKRRETWTEIVDRVFDMHAIKYKDVLTRNPEFSKLFNEAKQGVLSKKVLGSQRALQFGGEQILVKNGKLYNCAVTYVDRPEVFGEIAYVLLEGSGLGFSVLPEYINKLPYLIEPVGEKITFQIPDTIEGWSDAVSVLINSYFNSPADKFKKYSGKIVKFDYSLIRPAGSLISGGFKAPGPEPLEKGLEKIRGLLNQRIGMCINGPLKLRPIDAYDIVMHSADFVISGGVRRSATSCIFDVFDEEMMNAKIGDWYYKNPQRGRSNNTALLIRNETTFDQFNKLIQRTKEFGEPGFLFSDTREVVFNPCFEIAMIPRTECGKSGIQYCNLTEINGRKCSTPEAFYEACRLSAIIGTLQAGYTEFNYLGKITEEIVKREALLGCSITGMMDNPEVLFDEEIQHKGATIIKEINALVAPMIGINLAARCTAVKPAGTTSCVLGTASGIHPHHAKRYIRRVQANIYEEPLKIFNKINPIAVESSVWSANNTDMVISFLCEVRPGSITKNQLGAVELLDKVRLTQNNWVEYGTNNQLCVDSRIRHNVSNTITVKPEEWEDVTNYIYDNRNSFAAVSLLPSSGDKDYPQAPFTTIYTPAEMVKEYGDGSVFASGLIVDGLFAFDNNLWRACDTVLDKANGIHDPGEEPIFNENIKHEEWLIKHWEWKSTKLKNDWIRRAKQFAVRYFDGDLRNMTYCLKDVYNWKIWCDLKREYVDIDWSVVVEEQETLTDVTSLAATACAGNQCTIF
jgi:ribonucleoside-triphosphate reductase (thioredoxin)